jgi:putative transposase
VVERTFAWLGRFRRLSKDYEFLPATLEAVIHLAMIQLLIRRAGQQMTFSDALLACPGVHGSPWSADL